VTKNKKRLNYQKAHYMYLEVSIKDVHSQEEEGLSIADIFRTREGGSPDTYPKFLSQTIFRKLWCVHADKGEKS